MWTHKAVLMRGNDMRVFIEKYRTYPLPIPVGSSYPKHWSSLKIKVYELQCFFLHCPETKRFVSFWIESWDPLNAYVRIKRQAFFDDTPFTWPIYIAANRILQGNHSLINLIKFQYKGFFHLKEEFTVFSVFCIR